MRDAKEKAKELVDQYFNTDPVWVLGYGTKDTELSKKQALICVDKMESILTEYGEDKFELQNMDYMWRYLDDVRTEINKL